MAESKTGIKKAPAKYSVNGKRTTAKKITLKKGLDNTTLIKKTAPKKSQQKKAVVKKAPKTETKNTTVSTEKVKPAAKKASPEISSTDEQVSALIQEIRQGFTTFAEQGNEREERSLEVLKVLTETIRMDHEKSLQEVRQQEIMQDNRVTQLARRNRLIALPAAIISVAAILIILYVVNMLGTAMTSISTDIHEMRLSVSEISTRMDSMTLDINSMSGNIQQLNRNVTNMSKDMNVLSNTVAPTMRGLRNTMPWAP